MKKVIYFPITIIALLLLQLNLSAQITKQQAIDLVLDTIAADRLDSVNIYMDTAVLSNDFYVISPYDSIDAPYANYWFFFIDENPLYLWGHFCNYVFINESTGDYTLISNDLPPLHYKFSLDSISIPLQMPDLTNDFTMPYNVTTVQENPHLYAVLFSGYGSNEERPFWNHLSHMYCALIEKGFPEDNIFVLSGDGTEGPDPSQNHSIDLNNDQIDDIINVPCSIDELENVFEQLEQNLSDNDLLFVFATTHGTVGNGVDRSNLLLYNQQEMSDIVFAEMLEDINCSQMIIPIYACHAGGMVDDLEVQTNNTKRTAFGVVDYTHGYVRNTKFISEYGMDVFPYFLITAFRGYHPFSKTVPWEQGYLIGTHEGNNEVPPLIENSDFNPDITWGNNDGVIQINEVIHYSKEFDFQFEQMGVTALDWGFTEDLLSLTGISGNVTNTQTINGSFIIGGNLNLETGTTLTVDDETKLYLVNGNISTEGGSTLILKDDVLVHNFSEEAGFSVSGALQGGATAGTDVEFVTFSSAPATSLFMSVLTDVTFSACVFDHIALSGSGYTLLGGNDLIINQSSAFNHSLILGPGHYNIDNCTFSYSSIDFHPGPAMGWNCSAFIKNSSFYLPHPDKNNIISLSSVQEFNIEGDTFSNYADQYNGGSSLLLEYCGNYGTNSWKQIKDNIFTTIEGQTYSNTNGISLYSSNAHIRNNNIQYQQNGLSLYGNCQTNVTGSHWATSESGTQQIKNNSNLQVYASEYAFPNLFIYNVVYEDTYSQTYILHDLIPGHYPVENVNCNNWGQDTYPADNLLPLGHYECEIIWYFDGECNPTPQSAATLYQTGVDQVADSNYNTAQSTFEEVVTDYPDTEPANNAMKDLLLIEALVDSTDYSGRQDWFLTEPAILGNNRLKKIGENLANKCDEKLENYPDAIDWYEDMIDDPPSLQDSVFAIIDLENVYLEMGIDTNLRSAYMGRMPQYKPVSINAHQKHRDELLALLGNVNKNNTDDSFPVTEENSKPVELLKNTPNPFTGTTQISYNLKIESDVQLIVYTYTGQLIKTINIGTKTKGTHFIDFDASGLKSGIYFYSMNINGQTIDSKKMVILK